MGPSVMRGSTISKLISIVAGIFLLGAHAMAADGLTTIPSSYGPKETMDRLEAEIKAKGMTVFARIDHAAGAAQAGLSLRPTEVLIFGNAKAGRPLRQSNGPVAIALPLKALVWEDADGKVWLSYNEPSWLAHGLAAGTQATVDAMAGGLGALARGAATKQLAAGFALLALAAELVGVGEHGVDIWFGGRLLLLWFGLGGAWWLLVWGRGMGARTLMSL